MFRSKAPTVLFWSDELERFVIPKHGKDDVADLMHDSAHCYRFFLAGTLPGVIGVKHRVYRRAASLIDFTLLSATM